MPPSIPAVIHAVRHHSRADREQLLAFQNEHLRRVVRHAYANVPHYRRLWDRAGARPDRIASAPDLATLPITTRAMLQAAPAEDVIARGYDPGRLIARCTSGSSGQPLTIRHAWLEQNLLHLFRLRAMRAVGLRWRDRTVAVGGRRPAPNDNKMIGRTLQALGVQRRVQFPVLQPPERIAEQIVAADPNILIGYTGTLARVAGMLTPEQRRVLNLRMVFTGAEVLTPAVRRLITDAYGAPVYDLYGAIEFNLLAAECPATGLLHLCDDSVVVEVIRDGHPVGPGETGTIVATGLHGYAMPFVRYELGDLAVRGPERCPCGAPFATLQSVQGRMLDFFTLPDGRKIHPYVVVDGLGAAVGQWVGQYAVTQERLDRIVVRIVERGQVTADQRATARAGIEALVGAGVEVVLESVSAIDPEVNGKFRVARSLVGAEEPAGR